MRRCQVNSSTGMLEEIIQAAEKSTYDFRVTAYPEDPLQHLFQEWLPYYRLKWAIARILQPESILEIGVRFGYSALAFLDASPSAHYVGIDIDSPAFGGSVGAIDWAAKAFKKYNTEFVITDSTQLQRFPGDRYDLIHIDGQQDGVGTIHDLTLSVVQADYILVDGYFWSRQNFLSASEFLYRYRDLIEFYAVIPGYAGELLIKTNHQKANGATGQAGSSAALRSTYTKEYYLRDCGGYEGFKRTLGATLEDPRLQVIANLARACPARRALDLGSGRGELCLEFARRGIEVTGIDYSRDAVEIARTATNRLPDLSRLISLKCSDVNSADLQGTYDFAVAVDLIEHMRPEELDRLYARTAQHLSKDGLFIVHTYPNLWFYQYGYPKRLKTAARIGAYLPTEPRSRYELLMHINEQSPRVLKRQLAQHFPHVLLWFGSPSQPVDNLERKFALSEIRGSPDLFAVASHSPIPLDKLLNQFRMPALPDEALNSIKLKIQSCPSELVVSTHSAVSVLLENQTDMDLRSAAPYPVHLSYHWLSANGNVVVHEGIRTRLTPDAWAGSSTTYQTDVLAPLQTGSYVLRLTLVQEGVRWFDQVSDRLYCDVNVICSKVSTRR
jgi:predicted O-methyltransferase YrrM